MPSDREIQERFNELPQEVQAAIQSADMTSALQSTGSAHGLHIDQLGALEDEALLVMLGFANPAAFPEHVRAALNVDASTAALIAEELSEKLFVPIRQSMRTYMEIRLRRAKERQAAPPPSTPSLSTEAGATILPAAAGGKTILPSSAAPVLHPADQMLATPAVTMPGVTNFGATTATQPMTRYSTDPYREPVE